MLYAIKSLSNLAMSSQNVNLVLGEFGGIDILLNILQTQIQLLTPEIEDDLKMNINMIM